MFPSVNDSFVGVVVEVKPFGSFVEHPDGPHGLLYGESVEVGTQIAVRVIDVDVEKQRFSLVRA